MKYDVVIVGGGPGGLHCARILAENGVKTVILERKKQIGKKVCAGGITWQGLIKTIPETLIEKVFSQQIISTRYQQTLVKEPKPMVATVNRSVLGSYMAEQAEKAGAEIITGAYAKPGERKRLHFRDNGTSSTIQFDFLVGADGSNSRVRTYLRLPVSSEERGIGIQYSIDDFAGNDMIWNFDTRHFGCGYSWIFPHRNRASVGAYIGKSDRSASLVKKSLDDWLGKMEVDVSGCRLEADQINWDYRGWRFGSVFLVGDAAGLASPLTGEGINPAFVSGETVARTILDPTYKTDQLDRIIRRHQSHKKMLNAAARSPMSATMLSEICVILLRYRLISFRWFEMA